MDNIVNCTVYNRKSSYKIVNLSSRDRETVRYKGVCESINFRYTYSLNISGQLVSFVSNPTAYTASYGSPQNRIIGTKIFGLF